MDELERLKKLAGINEPKDAKIVKEILKTDSRQKQVLHKIISESTINSADGSLTFGSPIIYEDGEPDRLDVNIRVRKNSMYHVEKVVLADGDTNEFRGFFQNEILCQAYSQHLDNYQSFVKFKMFILLVYPVQNN